MSYKPKMAVCEFQRDGKVFPVDIAINESEAERRVTWMKVGQGQSQDWRAIPSTQLRELLLAGRVTLDCFTTEAQAEKRAAILAVGGVS